MIFITKFVVAPMIFVALVHVVIISLTNVTVQYPVTILGFHSTWGVFLYPLIFIITDLTVRFRGAEFARKTVLKAMLPGLVIAYVMTNYFSGHPTVFSINWMALRVATASFTAYLLGQLLDILVFQKFRQNQAWWMAPSMATLLGNACDTGCFFFMAFYHCNSPFFAQHWPEIALVDFVFKLSISYLSFIPLYGLALKWYRQANPQGLQTSS